MTVEHYTMIIFSGGSGVDRELANPFALNNDIHKLY